ncbi:MAG: hypothetical protein KDB11_30470 [Planctomycetales bacterium]|nr:hypothetical protein [Planctomycetales bacterium]
MRCLQITMAAVTMIVSTAMAHLEAAAAEERIPDTSSSSGILNTRIRTTSICS